MWRCSWCGIENESRLCPRCGKEESVEISPSTADRCSQCGVEPFEGEDFIRDRLPNEGVRLLCPDCQKTLRARNSRYSFLAIFTLALLIVVVALITGHRIGDTGITFYSAVVILQWLLIIPHELGHAVAAQFLGFSNIQISVGYGKPIFVFHFCRFDWAINRLPFGGFTRANPPSKTLRWKWLLYISAGLMINLLLLLVLLSVLPRGGLWGQKRTFITALLFANFFGIIANLIPRTVTTPHGIVHTDGYHLLNILLRSAKVSASDQRVSIRSVWARRVLTLLSAILFWAVVFYAITTGYFFIFGRPIGAPGLRVIGLLIATMAVSTGYRILKQPAPEAVAAFLRNTVGGQHFPAIIERSGAPLTVLTDLLSSLSKDDYRTVHDKATEHLQRHPLDRGLLICLAAALAGLEEHEKADDVTCQLRQASPGDDLSVAVLSLVKLQIFLLKGDRDRFYAECNVLLSLELSASKKVEFLDLLACVPLYREISSHGLCTALELAEFSARKALGLAPGRLTLKGTLGALVVEQGDLRQAEPLLRECYNRSSANTDLGICSYYLAVIAESKSEINTAAKLARESVHLCPLPWLRRKSTALLQRLEPHRETELGPINVKVVK